jgi:hypothetical protein
MNPRDYRRLAEAHKPKDEQTLRVAAVELHRGGLTERDIGEALSLDPSAVRRLLGERAERRA